MTSALSSSGGGPTGELVAEQLQHMVAFILREAKEKSMELMVRTRQAFNADKAAQLRAAKQALEAEYKRKENTLDVKKKIEHSNAVNKCRLRVLTAQDEVLTDIIAATRSKLTQLSKPDDPAYKERIYMLILQGLLKMGEHEVTVTARASDTALVEDVLPRAVQAYTDRTGRKCTASLNTEETLAPAPEPGSDAPFCSGGVVLAGHGGRIILDNTFDQRLVLAYEGLLPTLRTRLFGASPNRRFFA